MTLVTSRMEQPLQTSIGSSQVTVNSLIMPWPSISHWKCSCKICSFHFKCSCKIKIQNFFCQGVQYSRNKCDRWPQNVVEMQTKTIVLFKVFWSFNSVYYIAKLISRKYFSYLSPSDDLFLRKVFCSADNNSRYSPCWSSSFFKVMWDVKPKNAREMQREVVLLVLQEAILFNSR